MTIADSRVVAHRFRIRTSDGGKGCWVHDEGPSKYGDKTANGMEYQDLTPLSLLAEAEHEAKRWEVNAEQWRLQAIDNAKERDALQSRLDAVVGLADKYRELSDGDVSIGESLAYDEVQDEIRSAALGCESHGNEEETK